MTVYHPTDTMPAWLERAWMDRYLDRELDDGERDWFEAYMLDRPQLIEELEADEAVRAAVPSLPSEAADQLLGEAPAPTRTLRSSLRWLPLAAAASITGAVLSAALLQRDAVPVETAYAALLQRCGVPDAGRALEDGWTDAMIDAVVPHGDLDAIARKRDEYAAAGVEEMAFLPVGVGADPQRSVERTWQALAELV